MEVKVDHTSEQLVTTVKKGAFNGISVVQGDDLIYIDEDSVRKFVAAVRAVASYLLGEEV